MLMQTRHKVIRRELDNDMTHAKRQLTDFPDLEVALNLVKDIEDIQLEEKVEDIIDKWQQMEWKQDMDTKELESDRDIVRTSIDSMRTVSIAEDIVKEMNQMIETIQNWLKCQKIWSELQKTFSAEIIQELVPQKTAEFETLSKEWNSVKEGCSKCQKLTEMCDKYHEHLQNLITSMELMHNSSEKGDSPNNSDFNADYTFDGLYFENIEKVGVFPLIINLKNAIQQNK